MLGRPLQAFDHVAAQVANAVLEQLQHSGFRPVAMRLEDAQFSPLRANSDEGDAGLQAHIARASVQAHMAARYGFAADADASSSDALPPSATEMRITAALQAAVCEGVQTALALPHEVPSPLHSQRWQWTAQLHIGAQPPSPLQVELDVLHSHYLEARVARFRHEVLHTRSAPACAAPALHITLVARLTEKEFSAADIQALQLGSVLPISLGRATVLLNDEAMLSASVAEHQGKLHLTAFETLE